MKEKKEDERSLLFKSFINFNKFALNPLSYS